VGDACRMTRDTIKLANLLRRALLEASLSRLIIRFGVSDR
jgi:hypothetical protein